MSTREDILQALFAKLGTLTGPTVLRNEVLPEKVPAGGLLILRDGDPGEPEVLLSPINYYWTHRAELEVIVSKPAAADRDDLLDDILVAIAAALADDRTLGGKCDHMAAYAPQPSTLQIEGAPPFKGVIVPIELLYTTTDPLG